MFLFYKASPRCYISFFKIIIAFFIQEVAAGPDGRSLLDRETVPEHRLRVLATDNPPRKDGGGSGQV